MIKNLSDDILLAIFRYYLDTSPRDWPKLVHICRGWRRIVFASPRSLQLRLFCTPRTPVLETLSFWPALPIVVEYGGSPSSNLPVPEDEDNIVAALKQSDRVTSISLTVTKPLLEKLSAIERPFSELEDLVLLRDDDVPLTLSSKLSSTFLWGPRLRNLHLTGVAIPSLPQLLFHSTGLVDLQLHGISNLSYISPEAFASALSMMPHLRTLSLHFRSSAPYPGFTGLPSEPVTLLALRKLKYRGTNEYLDNLAARIDAPQLGNIDITFLSQPPPMLTPQIRKFFLRIAMNKSHRRADILFSDNAASISFTQPNSPTCLELQVSCETFSQQLSCIARICNGFNAFILFGIEDLHVCVTRPKSGHDYNDREEWWKLLHLFRGTKWAYINRDLSTDIILVLQRPEMSLLPALHKLCIQEPDPFWRKAVPSFIHSRLLSGHIITVEYERLRVKGLRGIGTAFFLLPIFVTHQCTSTRTLLWRPAGHDRDALCRHPSEHISSSPVSKLPNLANAHPRMPKLATDRIEIPIGPRSSTLLYIRNTCPESSRMLATLSPHREIWRISRAQSTGSRGRC